MKRSAVFALAIGGIISAVLLAVDHFSHSELDVMDWEMPGITAAYLFWGVVGSSVAAGMTVCWFVNALVYAAPAFVMLTVLRLLRLYVLTARADRAS